MRQAAELLQIDDSVVLAPAGVAKDITLSQRRRHRPIDAAGKPESELRHPAAERDARLLRREQAVEGVARHRLGAECIGVLCRRRNGSAGGLLEGRRSRIVGEQIDGVRVGEPFGDDLLVGSDNILGIAARRHHQHEQADDD